MICFIALALFARARTRNLGSPDFALGAATLVKFFPVILLPAIYRRWDKKLPIAFVTTIVIFLMCSARAPVFSGSCHRTPKKKDYRVARATIASTWSMT